MRFLGLLIIGLVSSASVTFAQYETEMNNSDGASNLLDDYGSNTIATNKVSSNQKVVLVGFEAMPMINEARQKTITIKWKTIKEKDNSHYTLQRSGNGVNFEDISEVKGFASCSENMFYEVSDKKPFVGTTYYRLKQTSFSGKVAYSNVVSSRFRQMEGIIAYNNKGSNANGINVIVESLSDVETEVKLLTSLGEVAFTQQVQLKDGMNDVPLNIKELSKGNYHVVVSVGNNTYSTAYKKN